MKLAAFILALPVLALGCQQTPLQNLRKMYTLEQLEKFQEERNVKGFMLNQAIFYDDVEIFTLFFTYGKSKRIDYRDPLLSQANRQDAEPIYFNPLHLAAQVGALGITKFCLENKADVNSTTTSQVTDFDKNTPAHIALTYGKHEVLKMLLSRGDFNWNSKNRLGKTIEDIAREKTDGVALSIIHEAKARQSN